MPVLQGLSLPAVVTIISVLGLPGLVFVFWYVDQRRYERQREEHKAEMAALKEQFTAMMAAQEKRFEEVVRMYENNILLVQGYEKLSGDLANIIHLNTQVQTKLVEKIDNNMTCPVIREGGLKAWGLTPKG